MEYQSRLFNEGSIRVILDLDNDLRILNNITNVLELDRVLKANHDKIHTIANLEGSNTQELKITGEIIKGYMIWTPSQYIESAIDSAYELNDLRYIDEKFKKKSYNTEDS